MPRPREAACDRSVSIRRAGAVGAGLAPARPEQRIRPGERIHVVGAAGAGASAAALHGCWAGARVTGCDPGTPSPYTAALEAAGIEVAPRHDPAHVRTAPHPDRLAVTKALTAIDPDHPELQAGRAAGIPVEPWQQVVADSAAGRTLVAVAGTHGKSTSAGWLVHVLVQAELDPAAFVGALLAPALTGLRVPATARPGRGPAFVVEADEYAGNFDPYRPAVALLTSVEWDHPDVFADTAAVVDAIEAWLRRSRPMPDGRPPVLVANVGDPGVAAVVSRLKDWPGRIVATSLATDGQSPARLSADLVAAHASALGPAIPIGAAVVELAPTLTRVQVVGLDPGAAGRELRLPTAGRHNVTNALTVAGAALALGLPADRIAVGLATFGGVGRRLELTGEAKGVAVYDDYAHHPTAIRETLAAVRQREPGRRAWAVYEPLTYHRTAALMAAFAEALAGADAVAIADIWAGRDPDTSIASAADLAAAVAARAPGIPCEAPGSVEATARWLARHARAGDVVLVMGGGRSYRIAELLLEHLQARA
jgi:UDP-N-acetylmuramate--alanine ligase